MNTARQTMLSAIALFSLISLSFLGQDLLGSNEAGKLALALQTVEPDWNSKDWYLNTAQNYQWLFQQISGNLLLIFGVHHGTILSRLIGYAVWSWSVALLCTTLGLTTLVTVAATGVFLIQQSLIAGEWMIGSAEPKTYAYAALFMAFSAWTNRRWAQWGVYSGLSASFHVLVGGYGSASLVLAGFILRRPQSRASWLKALSGALLGATPILLALKSSTPAQIHPSASSDTSPWASWIYTYLRNPHHLVPSSWSSLDWLRACGLIAAFGIIAVWTLKDQTEQKSQRKAFLLWSSITLIPFTIGLTISPWDSQGAWLRFYPFRVADSLIPLSTCILIGCQLERLQPRLRRMLAFSITCIVTLVLNTSQERQKEFNPQTNLDRSSRMQIYNWINHHTPLDAVITSSPQGFEDMSLLTGRPGIAQFKQIPNRSSDIQEWFKRMQDLSGKKSFWKHTSSFKARRRLARGFDSLSSKELSSLASQYNSDYVITSRSHKGPAGWRRAFSNMHWSIWEARNP